MSHKATYRSADSVLEELDQIRAMGIRTVQFMDDLMVTNLRRMRPIFDNIDPSWGMQFKVRARVDTLTEEICAYLAPKGVREITVGIESGSQRMLDLMGKRVTVAQNHEAIAMIKRHGMKAFADLFFMYPGETMESARATVDFIRRSRPTYVHGDLFRPLPGTPIVEELEREDLIRGKYGVHGVPEVIYDYLSDAEYERIVAYAKEQMRRYNRSLRHVVLPNLVDIARTAGPRQYGALWKRYGRGWLGSRRLPRAKAPHLGRGTRKP